MSRQTLLIRDAGPDDVDALVRLWGEAGRTHEQQQVSRPPGEAAVALAQIAADPDDRLVVGEYDDKVVAAVHMRRAPISPIHSDPVVHTSYLLVLPEYRKHGFARALLETAVSWAEEKDIGHIGAITASNSRDTNRFLARLGLAPVAIVRISTTAGLRKKLTPHRQRSRSLGHVLAQRRQMRNRPTTDS